MIRSKLKFTFTVVRDAFLCACLLFLILSGFQAIPFNAGWLEPAGAALEDFDWSDVYYSKIKGIQEGTIKNEHIVIVNIGTANREEITNTLLEIKQAGPEVTGLDIIFHAPGDSAVDARLDSVIQSFHDGILLGCIADSTYENRILSLEPMHIPFITKTENLGYVNFIGEEVSTVRSFYEREFYTGRMLNSFALGTMLKYKHRNDFDPFQSVATMQERLISYQSNSTHYMTLSWKDLVEHSIDPQLLKGKIVLVGFCGNDDGSEVINDKHFTPLNDNYAGKALPDMFGIFIHANIIEAYLGAQQTFTPRRWIQALAFILYITGVLFLYLYAIKLQHYWRKVTELFLQFIFAFLGCILAVYFLSVHGIKWNLGEIITAIALIEPVVGIYEVIIHFIGKAYPVNSIIFYEK